MSLQTPLYHYRLREVVSVFDGDTFRAVVDVGFRMYAEQSFRMAGIDTPELKGETYNAANTSRLYLKNRLETAIEQDVPVIIHSHKSEKYGRWLAEVWIGDAYLNSEMVTYGYARAYNP